MPSLTTVHGAASLRHMPTDPAFPAVGEIVRLRRWVQNEAGSNEPYVAAEVVGRVTESPTSGSLYVSVEPLDGNQFRLGYRDRRDAGQELFSFSPAHVTVHQQLFRPVGYWPELDGDQSISLWTASVVPNPAIGRPARTLAQVSEVARRLTTCQDQVQAGWLQDGLNALTPAVNLTRDAAGGTSEVYLAVSAYREAIRQEHWDRSKTTFDTAALRAAYLTARGAVAVHAESILT